MHGLEMHLIFCYNELWIYLHVCSLCNHLDDLLLELNPGKLEYLIVLKNCNLSLENCLLSQHVSNQVTLSWPGCSTICVLFHPHNTLRWFHKT